MLPGKLWSTILAGIIRVLATITFVMPPITVVIPGRPGSAMTVCETVIANTGMPDISIVEPRFSWSIISERITSSASLGDSPSGDDGSKTVFGDEVVGAARGDRGGSLAVCTTIGGEDDAGRASWLGTRGTTVIVVLVVLSKVVVAVKAASEVGYTSVGCKDPTPTFQF